MNLMFKHSDIQVPYRELEHGPVNYSVRACNIMYDIPARSLHAFGNKEVATGHESNMMRD